MEKPNEQLNSVQIILQLTFSLVPIMAGADKFTNLLANWGKYLDSQVANVLPVTTVVFMLIVGVIEIAAGLLVIVKPILGAYVVCAWLILISIILLATGIYFDVAIRDLVMAAGAFALARLAGITQANNNKPVPVASRN